MDDAPPPRPWVANKPEQRLSIALDRLLGRCLEQPHYITALHDADGTARTENQRARDTNRGVKSGQLDWDVVQGEPPIARKVELKRGKGTLSSNQKVTIAALGRCGMVPIVAWDLRQAYQQMAQAGFRFTPNVKTVVVEIEAHLAAWDREAEGIKSGAIVRKKSRKPRPEPRFTLGKRAVTRLRGAGIRI
jgi:hypothetical protein